jgi:shikimate dehydrogenase
MFPNISDIPSIPFHLLGPEHLIYDLIYNPTETLLLKNSSFNGCRTKNGLEMLKIQAEKSWEIWNS